MCVISTKHKHGAKIVPVNVASYPLLAYQRDWCVIDGWSWRRYDRTQTTKKGVDSWYLIMNSNAFMRSSSCYPHKVRKSVRPGWPPRIKTRWSMIMWGFTYYSMTSRPGREGTFSWNPRSWPWLLRGRASGCSRYRHQREVGFYQSIVQWREEREPLVRSSRFAKSKEGQAKVVAWRESWKEINQGKNDCL